ncbi:recombinase family protein [Bacillus thuringiensis]|uniref:recombinase family protein n=1 Tax=Bacillus thuringiensis TaxID=1428 RepID=UPI0005CE55ED|nr:recombinase family protein [Bacillus thuringiensis]
MLLGYMRPYQKDSKCRQQYDILKKMHCKKFFLEESTTQQRKQLQQMLDNLSPGDIIIVTNFFIIADSIIHLDEILKTIDTKKAYIKFLNENIDTSISTRYHLNDILISLITFQTDIISDRTTQGMYKAKQKGISTGRPKKTNKKVQLAINMYKSKKYSLNQIVTATDMSKSSLYRYLHKAELL